MKLQTAAIIGAFAIPVGRLTPRGNAVPQGLEHDILTAVAASAIEQAGIDRDDIDCAIFTQNPPTTRQQGFASLMMAQLGLRCRGLVSEVSQLGVTGGLAFDLAATQIQLGRADLALALGIVVQSKGDTGAAIESGIRSVGDVNFQSPFGLSPIAWYALDARRYMYETGASRADIAEVAVKSRGNARLNPLAQFREPLSLESILSQRPICEPLGLYEVPARADGAICLVLCNENKARSLHRPYVRLRGRGYYHEGFHQIADRHHDMIAFPAATHAFQSALKDAEIGIKDLDLAELYAPCTITEILVSEAMGFFERGQGVRALHDGVTSIHGSLPINTSGGCLSRGHPPQLTGLYGLLELYEQLLGNAGDRQVNNAQLGVHVCELGNYNAALTHVLEAAA